MKSEEQKIHESVTVATRYNEIKRAGENAINAIQNFRSKLFTASITDEERTVLRECMSVIEKTAYKYGEWEAINYLKENL